MFLGEHQHALDAKGRITIPVKLRYKLGERFIATKGLDKCIFLFPISEWQELDKKLGDLPSLSRPEARSFVRFFYSGASELEMDKQGRTVLPINLREYAEIDKDIFIVGVGSRIEIWSQDKWTVYNKEAGAAYEAQAESIVDLGI